MGLQLREDIRDAPARPGCRPARRPNGTGNTRVISALLALMTLTASGPGALALDPSSTPTRTGFSVVESGEIIAIVPRGDVTYVGGNFDALAAITGAFARLDATTGKRSALLAEAEDGEVRASAPDGNGGYYIGGTFTRLGGVPRARIGHILADGSVDPDFDPGVLGQSSAVGALAVSADGGTLYVGGKFDSIGGRPRNNLAAIDLGTGEVTRFDPAGLGTDGPVHALEVAGTQVYVGGAFEKLGGQIRNGLAKVAGDTGGDLGWVPNPSPGGAILAIEASGSSVYVGGSFNGIGGQPHRNLARLTATNGVAFAEFAPNPGGGGVYSLLLSGSGLYAGGSFDTIRGEIRPALVRLNATTGYVTTSFFVQARYADTVESLALSGTDLYIGGIFPDLGYPAVSSKNLVKVNANTGAGVPAFVAQVGPGPVKTIAVGGTSVFAGGDISYVNKVTRRGIAALDADGIPTAFDPDAGPDGSVHAIAVRDNDIYLGGNFTSMGGEPRNRIAKVSREGTLDPSFDPNATGGDSPLIATIVVTSADVYVGGDFSRIGGQPRLDLARLNPVTGQVDGGRQSFDPDPLDGLSPSSVHSLQVSGDEVYVAGEFTSIGGQLRNKIAKISGATGDADVQFDANVGGDIGRRVGIFDIVLARGTLFVAGDFSTIGGAARNDVAALNPRTGAEVTGFTPNVTGEPSQVYDLEVRDDEVYIGGTFTHVGGQEQRSIARLSLTGALTGFDPSLREPAIVLALAATNSTLYVGGYFLEVGARSRSGYAQFTATPAPVALDTIDDAAPASAVQPLDGVQQRALFAVEWAGDDEGAGLRDYSVFVATDGGPFTPWRTHTTATTALFQGEDGVTYEFYSIARDLAGNLEAKEPMAEATTMVLLRPDDGDGDGVPDAEDRCAGLAPGATVVVDGLDTGVANAFADAAGCTLGDRIGEAAAGALNLRQFLRRVDRLTRTWLRDALLDEAQADVIRSAAAQATLLPP